VVVEEEELLFLLVLTVVRVVLDLSSSHTLLPK
jgi:hypothetical protein